MEDKIFELNKSIRQLTNQNNQLRKEIIEERESHDNFCNSVARCMPEGYDGDESIEQLILKWAKDTQWLTPKVGDIIHIGPNVNGKLTIIEIDRTVEKKQVLSCADGIYGHAIVEIAQDNG